MRRREFITLVVGGTAFVRPFMARAQHSALPAIGPIHGGSASQNVHTTAAFHDGLGETGYLARTSPLNFVGQMANSSRPHGSF